MRGALMKYQACVTRVVKESPDVQTIFFTINDAVLASLAGQYVTVYAAGSSDTVGKAYSLSSAPHDNEHTITVKAIGGYSHWLCSLQPGDGFAVSEPYGFFNVDDAAPIIGIAAGVGVSPIWSIIRDQLNHHADRAITLYLTAPHEDGLIFRTAIDELFSHSPSADACYFVTQSESAVATHGRFVVSRDIPPASLAASRFYVCGSESFVRGVWRQLMEAAVDEDRIVTETFFETVA